MAEHAEYRRQTIGERIQARLDYIFRPSGPISKEVVRQITKIQSDIPYGDAWKAFEKAKQAAPVKMSAKDEEFRKQGTWHALTKLAQLWFFAPIVVMFSGRSPAAKERGKIRESAKAWRTYLSKNPEGKKMIGSYAEKSGGKRIDDIVTHIIAGQPPEGKNKTIGKADR